MTLYAIYDPQPGQPEPPLAVPEKFSWLAAILPPVFLIAHGMWLELLVYVLQVSVLMVLSRYIGEDATSWLYILLAIWLGFAATGLRRHALQWRGWTHRGDRVALSADLAQLGALR